MLLQQPEHLQDNFDRVEQDILAEEQLVVKQHILAEKIKRKTSTQLKDY
jgi:hypothetical protein